jgi:cysteinyl-tRNA synthetase
MWLASYGFRNYGKFKVNGTYKAAHRVAYELHHKYTLSKDEVIMHTCDNPSCCNPNHLRKGTQSDNVLDKMTKGRHRFETPWGRPGFHSEYRWKDK